MYTLITHHGKRLCEHYDQIEAADIISDLLDIIEVWTWEVVEADTLECPDCGATTDTGDGMQMEHSDTCDIALAMHRAHEYLEDEADHAEGRTWA